MTPTIDISKWNEVRKVDQDGILVPHSWGEIPMQHGMMFFPSSNQHHHVLTVAPSLQMSSHPQQQDQQQITFLTPTTPTNNIAVVDNQQAQYMSSEIRMLEREFPMMYTLLVQQQTVIEQQRVQLENATQEIAHLSAELPRLQSCQTQCKDKVPPVILVEKDGHSLTSDKGGTLTSSSVVKKKGQYSPPVTTDSYHCDSLPLKKRRRCNDTNKQDLSKVLRILEAATSSSA
jgi:hypothetical protein